MGIVRFVKDSSAWAMFFAVAFIFLFATCGQVIHFGPVLSDRMPDSGNDDASRWDEPPDSSTDADISYDDVDIIDAHDSDDGFNESDSDTVTPERRRCRSDADCSPPEGYCHPQVGLCYDGETMRCGGDADCPAGWGSCSPDDGVCSG